MSDPHSRGALFHGRLTPCALRRWWRGRALANFLCRLRRLAASCGAAETFACILTRDCAAIWQFDCGWPGIIFRSRDGGENGVITSRPPWRHRLVDQKNEFRKKFR